MLPATGVVASISNILDPIAKPIADILAAIYHVVPNYGVAILAISVAWMIIIAPLTLKSTRSMLAMSKLQPQLQRLREQHRNDRQAFAQAQMDLMREHNVSPFGSCLPLLLQMPVFFALFYVIDGLSHHTASGQAVPRYLSHSSQMFQDIQHAGGHLNAFGLDLAKNALSSHSSFATAAPYFGLLLIMMATQYVQTAQMMSRNPAQQNNPQAKIMKFLPLVFGVFCIRFPAGVVLYYAMSNLCRIVQQDLMYRFDPKVKALVAQEVVEVEAKTHDIDEQQGKGRPGARSPARAPEPEAPTSGRGRLRDLLAAASEQQAKAREAKAAELERRRTARAGGNPASPARSAGGRSGGAPAGGGMASGGRKATAGSKGAGAKSASSGAGTGAKGSRQPAKGSASKKANAASSNGREAPNTEPGANGAGANSTPAAAGRTGGGRTGARAASGRQPSGRAPEAGHRTNRKRRGR